ncbi:hypothetical protein [Ascidiaceihabitans sp.]|uniref:hypothetical protein n=1 Tax=Ascidiaceihabitans sp. TaxID=1872644 RepID=UPI003298E283
MTVRTQHKFAFQPAMSGAARNVRVCAVWVFCACFLAAASLAPGTMPQAQYGGFTVVLCTGDGPVTMTLDENGDPIEAQHAPCDWSAQVIAADVPLHAPLATPARLTAFVPNLEAPHVPVRFALVQPNPARGPPQTL